MRSNPKSPEVGERSPLLEKSSFRFAVGRSLQDRVDRWSQLAQRPASQFSEYCPEAKVATDPVSAAVWHLQDAKNGTCTTPHIHSSLILRILTLRMHPLTSMLVRAVSFALVILPMLEEPHYFLKPVANYYFSTDGTPSVLGSSVIEVFFALVLTLDILGQLILMRGNTCPGVARKTNRKRHFSFSRSQIVFVALLWLDLTAFFLFRKLTGLTWFRWSRCLFPFILINKSLHLHAFLAGAVGSLPHLIPMLVVIAGFSLFFAYSGFVLFTPTGLSGCTRLKKGPLHDIKLFNTTVSSMETMSHVFLNPALIPDIDEEYQACSGIRVFFVTYSSVCILILGTLMVAAASRAFTDSSKMAYSDMLDDRTEALQMAYCLLKDSEEEDERIMSRIGGAGGHGSSTNGTPGNTKKECYISLGTWKELVARLRPDLLPHAGEIWDNPPEEKDAGGRATFFGLCTLLFCEADGEAHSKWHPLEKCRAWARALARIFVPLPFTSLQVRLAWAIFHTAVLVNAVAILKVAMGWRGDMPRKLEAILLSIFCLDSIVYTLGWGLASVLRTRKNRFNLILNTLELIHFAGLWPAGHGRFAFYLFLMTSRLLLTFRTIMISIRPGAEQRFAVTFVAAGRAFMVTLGVVYGFSVLSFGFLGSTSVGYEPIAPIESDPSVTPYLKYREVYNFVTFNSSFLTLIAVMVFKLGWPLVVDVAAIAWGKLTILFIYTGCILVLYVVNPLMVGFVVKSYMSSYAKTPKEGRKLLQAKSKNLGLRYMQDFYHKEPGEGGKRAISNGAAPARITLRQVSQNALRFEEEEPTEETLKAKLRAAEAQIRQLIKEKEKGYATDNSSSSDYYDDSDSDSD